MKKTVVAIALVSVAFFAACNGDADNNAQDSYSETGAPAQDEQSAQGVSLNTTSGEMIDPSAPSPTAGSVASEAGVALNPPHGEPGHRCEIPVGAPLNSDPVNNNMVQQQLKQDHAQPITIEPQQPSAPSGNNSGARLNPPHGQPGHDCAVAVGAPLP